jgi:4-hydroxy-tetrahydrodipicolinate synthase
MFWETNPIPVKAALEIRGHMSGRLRSPLTDLTAENRDRLEALLAEYDEFDGTGRDGGDGGEVAEAGR